MGGTDICAELERRRADGAPLGRLLECAVELVHDIDSRFDWTGIYELGADEMLRLGPFRGPATDHVLISVGTGVCGAAVAEKRNLNVPDVSQVPNYLAGSPATRSELVVLIRHRERIYGQIDIDSHQLDAFEPKTVRSVEQVADWLAHAYGMRELARR